MEFNGKIGIVTGASSGIGRATAVGLSKGGASVALVGRNQRALRETAIECDSDRTITIVADITKEEDSKRIISETIERFGGIDVLINAAGILSSGTIQTTTEDQWDQMMNINVRPGFSINADGNARLDKTQRKRRQCFQCHRIAIFSGSSGLLR